MKTSELTGAALDWAVAKCEGLPLRLDPMGFKRDSPGSPQAGWWVWFGTPFSMIVGYAQKSNKDQRGYSPSTDWAQGGPIIEREGICVRPDLVVGTSESRLDVCTQVGWIAASHYNAQICRHRHEVKASTPLTAAMRCYVASKLGDEVEIPAELQ